MIIKKFTGKTEEEALAQARRELGAGVVIMNVKQVKASGVLGFLRAKNVEITVALEEEQDVSARNAVPDLSAIRKAAEKTLPQGDKSSGVNLNIEQKLDSLQTLLETQIKEKQDSQNPGPLKEDASPEKEKEEKEEPAGDCEQDKVIRLLYNTMLDNEVDEKYANQLLEEMEKNKKHNLPMDHILANIYQKLVLKFGKSEEICPAQQGPKLVLFIGPTGVGKTTTIAKLASRYAIEEKKKVALLTADTYRIAAAEQLRTYADILEVPFRVIYTAEEFTKACTESFSDYDYIFVDTAGHSHQNVQQLGDTELLIKAIPESLTYQCFLVLSATTKYRDLLRIANTYKELTEYQLIFTKLDETSSLGNLLNMKLAADTPIAYVTYGQNVPDDIEEFNPQKTVKQLLGGKG